MRHDSGDETAAPVGSSAGPDGGIGGTAGGNAGREAPDGPAQGAGAAPAGTPLPGSEDETDHLPVTAADPHTGPDRADGGTPGSAAAGGDDAAADTAAVGGARRPPAAGSGSGIPRSDGDGVPSGATVRLGKPGGPPTADEAPVTVVLGTGATKAAHPADPPPPATDDDSPRDAEPTDAAPQDAGPDDRSPQDAGPEDAGPEDALPEDGSPRDVEPADAAPQDARTVAGGGWEDDTPAQPSRLLSTDTPPAPYPPADSAGRLLAGRYRLGSVVGRGGMGTVWRATDEILGRSVAVKELRLPSGIDDVERRRLVTRTLREAKAIAAIRGRGVVTIYDVVDEGARPWIVMELIEGRSLAEELRHDGTLTPRRAAEVGLAVLDVLAAAHRAGIVHRDVKPSNVLISQADGRVVLTDFGIAKAEGDTSVTSTGMLVGAPSYISPERARGDDLGPAADYWSLGALLFCAVAGHPPYERGSAISTLTAVLNDSVEIPETAGPLTEVIDGLLLKDPEERFDEPVTRAMLRAVVRPAAAGSGAEATTPATPVAGSPATMVLGHSPAGRGAADGAAVAGEPAETTGPPTERSDPPGPGGAARAGGADATPVRGEPVLPPVAAASPVAAADGPGAGSPAGTGAEAAPGASGGQPPRGPGRGKRLAMLAGAGVAALALVGGLLLMQRGGDDGTEPGGGPDQTADPTDDTAEEPGPDDGQGGADDPGDGEPDGEPEPPGDPEPEPEPDDTGDQEPEPSGPPGTSPERDPDQDFPPEDAEGFTRLVNLSYRFSMSFPDGWRQTGTAGRNSGAIYEDPAVSPPSVQVDMTRDPGDDAREAWLALEDSVRANSTDYERISLTAVEWRDYPTVADWEFERTVDGERVRVLNRGFRVNDDRGYAIMVTCVADEWDGNDCRTLRDTAHDSFMPLD